MTALTESQQRVLDGLLAPDLPRPVPPEGLVARLRQQIDSATEGAGGWLSKSRLVSALRCAGMYAAEKERPRDDVPPTPVVHGLVSHRAVQLTHTHAGLPVSDYVKEAVEAVKQERDDVQRWWAAADLPAQSDLLTSAEGAVASWLDDIPPLDPAWSPRFEVPVRATVGRTTLLARPDLLLGRPRPRQTMFVLDIKSGPLRDHHEIEARYYSLVVALRYGVPPFRSAVYSALTGSWTTPADVNEDTLHLAAEEVCLAIRTVHDADIGMPPALLSPGDWCRWCPANPECPEAQQEDSR